MSTSTFQVVNNRGDESHLHLLLTATNDDTGLEGIELRKSTSMADFFSRNSSHAFSAKKLVSSRLYVGYGPMPPNPDPNSLQYYGGNVTQVDLYSIPMAFDVVGVKGTTYTRGITMGATGSAGVTTQEDLVRKYREFVSGPFRGLLQKNSEDKVIRFIAPFHGENFQEKKNGKDKNYFDEYVDKVWKQFSSNPALLDFYDQGGKVGNRFYGCTPDAKHQGQIAFMYTSMDQKFNTGPWYLEEPTTLDVLTNGGKFQPGTQSKKLLGEGNAFGRELAAA